MCCDFKYIVHYFDFVNNFINGGPLVFYDQGKDQYLETKYSLLFSNVLLPCETIKLNILENLIWQLFKINLIIHRFNLEIDQLAFSFCLSPTIFLILLILFTFIFLCFISFFTTFIFLLLATLSWCFLFLLLLTVLGNLVILSILLINILLPFLELLWIVWDEFNTAHVWLKNFGDHDTFRCLVIFHNAA